MKQEISAGGVVYKKVEGDYLFLIGKHSGYHKWVLPKGMMERGENEMETATREVLEEVGVRAKIVDVRPLKTIEYFYVAHLQEKKGVGANGQETVRRVMKYQEDPGFAKATTGEGRVKVHKKVIFYLMEMEEDLVQAGWEMEDRKWVSYKEGLLTLEFETEREVFVEAGEELGIGAPDQN